MLHLLICTSAATRTSEYVDLIKTVVPDQSIENVKAPAGMLPEDLGLAFTFGENGELVPTETRLPLEGRRSAPVYTWYSYTWISESKLTAEAKLNIGALRLAGVSAGGELETAAAVGSRSAWWTTEMYSATWSDTMTEDAISAEAIYWVSSISVGQRYDYVCTGSLVSVAAELGAARPGGSGGAGGAASQSTTACDSKRSGLKLLDQEAARKGGNEDLVFELVDGQDVVVAYTLSRVPDAVLEKLVDTAKEEETRSYRVSVAWASFSKGREWDPFGGAPDPVIWIAVEGFGGDVDIVARGPRVADSWLYEDFNRTGPAGLAAAMSTAEVTLEPGARVGILAVDTDSADDDDIVGAFELSSDDLEEILNQPDAPGEPRTPSGVDYFGSPDAVLHRLRGDSYEVVIEIERL